MPCKYSYYSSDCESSKLELICLKSGSLRGLVETALPYLKRSVKDLERKRLCKLENR